MKIAIVSPWAIRRGAVGGTERFVMDLAESLARINGNSVKVYMFSGDNHVLNGIEYEGIDLLGTNVPVDEYTLKEKLGDFAKPETYQKLADQIETLIDGSQFDVIHINTQLLLLAWSTVKRVFTVHTNPFEYKQAWGASSYPVMLELAKAAGTNPLTLFTAPSAHYASIFAELFETHVSFIPHAIAQDRLKPELTKESLFNKYNLNSELVHILLPSRLEPEQKRPQLLFEALNLLPAELTQRIEIISSGVDPQYEPYRLQFESMAQDKGYKVHFMRFETMSDAYEIADVVVLPSKSESFGYSALESLSLGIPTVVSEIPTFQEIAAGNPQAVFFDSTSIELAQKLTQLLNDKAVRRSKPPKLWADRYSIEKWAQQYQEIMQ